ncbi:cytochrome bd-I ubiquinol oxidase subunit 1 apoprotein [Tenacibaculum mesophilum]|uniref:Cytochrome ubiquinol oxidase subunit I n=1 Tax=Tenacibaculum mesophilum TaxID=104268 RepID=A0ABN5T5H0_9FLAO|nr:cytochrome ubiquinol oxidase subunit I [Tenacibaculum mesophilum]AZJ32596.1 cytochrome ubiquinol oxidase subunit I [Tenacibaculum mesophilum]QFS27847.1 cytochrome ubiquinol oxidase subunit I [Tenacibaculum mesophilum]SHG07474.1 cytochrome bd-I ubiquinol oxidase subunit 1 apoprotein [Tenacibaculum mesophilum]
MEDMLFYDRMQFAFTITFHYLFPQLTMGLSLMIVFFKWKFLRTKIEKYNDAAKFWMKIFALNFAMGVVTGIPMEFQFGTNWAKFSELTGGIIGQTLAMEGMFSFFLESSFLGLFLFGEKKLGHKLHFLTGFLVFLGSWASGFLIIATHSWMQNPVGYEILANGKFVLNNFSALFSNPWLWPSYLHNQAASLVTSSFVVAGIGALYLLNKKHVEFGKLFLKTGVVFGVIASILVAFPTGDLAAKNVVKYQPTTFAAMEGIFETEKGGSEIVLIGQPNMLEKKLDNKIAVPNILSFLTYQEWNAEIKGLNEFDEKNYPTNIPGLYYAYHIMVGLGTIFIALMLASIIQLFRKKLYQTKLILWSLLFMIPFPYIANTTGWYTAELGRQPWLVYNLLRTSAGASPTVSSGNTLFTLLGFIGLYLLLGMLFLILVGKIINKGPQTTH